MTAAKPGADQSEKTPPLTLEAIDTEAVRGNPLMTPFGEFVNEKLLSKECGVVFCS